MSILGRHRDKYQAGSPYPADPPKQPKRMEWYRAALRASIMARTCPELLTEPEVITVLGEASLASFSTLGAPLYRAVEVRQKLAGSPRQKLTGDTAPNPSISAGYLGTKLTTGEFGAGVATTTPPTPSKLLQRQLSSPGPVLRQVAQEALRDAGATPATASALPPIPEWARAPASTPRVPLKATSKPCADCGGRTQFDEKITCGICDRRPRLRVVEEHRCRYCGAVKCDCAVIKAGIIARGETRDDQILLAVHRVLAQRDRQRLHDAEHEESRKHRAQLRRRRARAAA